MLQRSTRPARSSDFGSLNLCARLLFAPQACSMELRNPQAGKALLQFRDHVANSYACTLTHRECDLQYPGARPLQERT